MFLPDWAVSGVEIDFEGAYLVSARYELTPEGCPNCGVRGDLRAIKESNMTYRDAPIHGRPVNVRVSKPRYKCRSCKQTFTQWLPHMDNKRDMTRRCIRYIQEQSLLKPNTHVAEEVGMDEKTVRTIGKEYTDRLNQAYVRDLRAPRVLGIDEVTLAGSLRTILLDIEQSWPIELLANRKNPTIINFLMNLDGRKEVEVVTMDMCDPFRKLTRKVMPQAAIIADRWHVIKKANDAMLATRRQYQKTLPAKERAQLFTSRAIFQKRRADLSAWQELNLDGWLQNHPELRRTHEVKDAFLEIWELETREEARAALKAWRASVPRDLKKLFASAIRASKNWEHEILNFFDHGRHSNGKVEGRNNAIKTIERVGAGYKFDEIRNRALFGKRPPRVKDEEAAKLEAWRQSLPTCFACGSPFDEEAEKAYWQTRAAQFISQPRAYPELGPCHRCLHEYGELQDQVDRIFREQDEEAALALANGTSA